MSVDPMSSDDEQPLTLNGYHYAGGNPVLNVDPTGGEELVSLVGVSIGISILSAVALPSLSWASKRPAREIKVDIGRQHVSALERGISKYEMDAITGDKEHPTPRGDFKIYRKARIYRSKKYDAQMNYAMFFNGGVALHQFHGPPGSFWVIRLLKSGVSDYFGSHGCVRLTEEDASTLFDWAKEHDPVAVK